MLLKSVHNFFFSLKLKKNNYKLIIKIVYQNHQVKTTFFYAIKDLKHIYNTDADLLRWLSCSELLRD
jgi:hypothetical protein